MRWTAATLVAVVLAACAGAGCQPASRGHGRGGTHGGASGGALDLHPAGGMQWSAASASLPAGTQVTRIEGDPAKSGPYVLRFRFPDGCEVRPHTHPADERATVLKGTMHMGTGGTFDRAKTTAIPAGSFVRVPAGTAHYAWFEGETVLQLHGTGPWKAEYVNPADDPRKHGDGR